MIYSKINQRAFSRYLRKSIGIRVLGRGRGYIEAIRADGLKVFLDGDRALDRIRTSDLDPRVVILAVAYRRAQQIACSYAAKYTPRLLNDIRKAVGYNETHPSQLSFNGNKLHYKCFKLNLRSLNEKAHV